MAGRLSVITRSPDETRIVGAALAPALVPGDVVSLNGDLGAGKTVFVQGLAGALGARTKVTSPSFTIVHEYQARYPVVHLDLYRLGSYQEILDLGFEELLGPPAIAVIEWGAAAAQLLPKSYLEVHIRHSPGGPTERALSFEPRGSGWTRKLASMRQTGETLLDAASSETSSSPRFTETPAA